MIPRAMQPNAISDMLERSANDGDPTSVVHELLASAGFEGAKVASFEVLNGGNPVMSQVFRIYLPQVPQAPETAIVKIPASGAGDRKREAATGSYAREIAVYRLLTDMQGKFQPVIYSTIYASASKTAALLMEDLGAMPDRSSFNVETTRRVLSGLAAIHRRFWDNPRLGDSWWIRAETNADIFNEDISSYPPNWEAISSCPKLHPCNEPELNRVGEFLNKQLPKVLHELERRPRTLTHGDLHTANLMFRRSQHRDGPVLIDWQDAVYSGASSDVAKFLSTTLHPDLAAVHFNELIAGYHDELGRYIRKTYRFSEFRRDVMLALLGTFANYVIAAQTTTICDASQSTLNASLRRVASVINVVKPLEWL